MSGLFRFGISAVFVACSSPSGSIAVTLGGETDTVSRSPAVDSYIVEAVDRSGNRQTLTQAKWSSGGSVDLGQLSQSVVASIQLTGSDANANAIVWGAVPFATLGVFDGLTIPLFVQRKGEFARMPGTIADARNKPLLQRTARGVYYAGGSLGGPIPPTGAYDLLLLQDFGSTLAANRVATSFAIIQLSQTNQEGDSALALLIDSAGVDEFGLATDEIYSPGSLPEGKSWADLAGGQTIVSPDDGTVYIIGSSKPDAVSSLVLQFPQSGTGSTLEGVRRQGAAVAWAPKRGVFVYGGSATEVGAEIITSSSQPLPQKSDATQGLAAVAFDSSTMLIAGTADTPHKIDLACTQSCAPIAWGKPLPQPLTSPSLFAIGKETFLIVGDDPSGATVAYRLSETSTDEKDLKIPRTGARAIQVETGQVVIIGGGNATPESYVD